MSSVYMHNSGKLAGMLNARHWGIYRKRWFVSKPHATSARYHNSNSKNSCTINTNEQ